MSTANEYRIFKSCQNGWSQNFKGETIVKNTLTKFKNHLFKHQLANFDYPYHKIYLSDGYSSFVIKEGNTLFHGGGNSKNVSTTLKQSTEGRNLYKESRYRGRIVLTSISNIYRHTLFQALNYIKQKSFKIVSTICHHRTGWIL